MLINLIYWALLHKVRLTWEGKALECASHCTGRGDGLLCKPLHHSTFGWVSRHSPAVSLMNYHSPAALALCGHFSISMIHL